MIPHRPRVRGRGRGAGRPGALRQDQKRLHPGRRRVPPRQGAPRDPHERDRTPGLRALPRRLENPRALRRPELPPSTPVEESNAPRAGVRAARRDSRPASCALPRARGRGRGHGRRRDHRQVARPVRGGDPGGAARPDPRRSARGGGRRGAEAPCVINESVTVPAGRSHRRAVLSSIDTNIKGLKNGTLVGSMVLLVVSNNRSSGHGRWSSRNLHCAARPNPPKNATARLRTNCVAAAPQS